MSDTIEGVENTFCGILAATQFIDGVYKMTQSNRFNWSPRAHLTEILTPIQTLSAYEHNIK